MHLKKADDDDVDREVVKTEDSLTSDDDNPAKQMRFEPKLEHY